MTQAHHKSEDLYKPTLGTLWGIYTKWTSNFQSIHWSNYIINMYCCVEEKTVWNPDEASRSGSTLFKNKLLHLLCRGKNSVDPDQLDSDEASSSG